MSTPTRQDIESPYAWVRLIVSLLIMTIGGSGMYSITVVLPQIQEEFGITRSDASLPYTLTMVGFGLGGILMGKISDRFGVVVPLVVGTIGLGLGFIVAGMAHDIWVFNLTQGLLIGLLGTSATFAPLVADTSQWFSRRRGIAVAVCMSGNYLGGTVWPPIMQYFVDSAGWRHMYMGVGVFCILTMLPLSFALRRRAPNAESVARSPSSMAPWRRRELANSNPDHPLGFTPNMLQGLLCVAGVACCVAMAMPQVHIVAYCGDLGFGAARGAEMLALMMGLGIISRLVSGWISDRIGGLRTLLLGSVLQGIALLLFLNYNGIVSLFIISGMFGLFQGGIVPAYAVIVREYFSVKEAGARIGTVLMATLLGMALGGWLSGAIYDLTYSYHAAFVNGTAWNLLNISIVSFLLYRSKRGPRGVAVTA
ncbi:MAG: MFS transporter [Paralcaligenes sp.]